MTHLSCREFSEFLEEYLSGQMADDVRQEFETHMGKCHNCDVYLEQYRSTIRAGQLACADDEAEGCPEELVRAVMAALKKEPR